MHNNILKQDFLNLKVPIRSTVGLNPPALKRSWFHNSLIIKSDKESRRPQMILSPFFTALCCRYERRLYRWFRRHVCWPQHSSQDNSRRPPLRLEREDVHWGKRRRCGGQRRSASGRAVVPHIGYKRSFPYLPRHKHTHSHAPAHARIWVTTARSGVQRSDLIWSTFMICS